MRTALALIFLALPVCAHAAAQNCGPYDKIVAKLTNQYSEAPIWEGLTSNGNLLTIYVSQTGTWTALETNPNGTACARSAGQMWTRVNFPPGSEM